jgi:hypothetical protein
MHESRKRSTVEKGYQLFKKNKTAKAPTLLVFCETKFTVGLAGRPLHVIMHKLDEQKKLISTNKKLP